MVRRALREEETMKKTRMAFCALFYLISVTVVVSISLPFQRQSDILSQFKSDDWRVRAAALRALIGRSELLTSPGAKQAIIKLLDTENHLMRLTLRESHELTGVSVKYGEDYSAYYSTLLSTAAHLADSQDSRTLEVLARSAYDPDSPLALKLAEYGVSVIPYLLTLSQSDLGIDRGTALVVLGRILRLGKTGATPIPRTLYRQVKKVLIYGTTDRESAVRMQAVGALGIVGDKDTLPVLQKIAVSDPAVLPTAEPGRIRHPVREKAMKAIERIERESGANKR